MSPAAFVSGVVPVCPRGSSWRQHAFNPPRGRSISRPQSRRCRPRFCMNSGGDSVAERIAFAFVAACTPGDKPYAEQLAEFCREVLRAYSSGFTLVAVQLEMAGTSTTAALGRALQSDEVELRGVWLALVYKTLRHIGFPLAEDAAESNSQGAPEGFERDRLDDFVRSVVAADAKGYDQKRIQLEQQLSADGDTPARTPLENAILQQSVRIVLTTLSVAREQPGSAPPPSLA